MSETKSPIIQPHVRQLQEHLHHDNVTQREYLDHDASDSSSVSESSDAECRVTIPRRRNKGKAKSIDFLLQELITQQKMYLKSQMKVMLLKSERDVEEVRTRYLKLDLNNSQVAVEEGKERATTLRKTVAQYAHSHFRARTENWITRLLIVLWVIFQVYTYSSPK